MKEIERLEVEKVLKDIQKNHNHSVFEEIYERFKDQPDKVAIVFRNNKITYGQLFEEVIKYAKALRQAGINKGDEFVTILRQTPDYPILFLASSYIGCKVILADADFNEDFLTDLIINKASSKKVFVNDWDFKKVSPVLKNVSPEKDIVVLPVSKWDKYNNPFSDITDRFFKFDEEEYKDSVKEFTNVQNIDDFLDEGKNYEGEVSGHTTLDDAIAVTFSSGSTKPGFHKGIVQRNKTYIIMSDFLSNPVAKIPPMDGVVCYQMVPVLADTLLQSIVSNSLIQGGVLALDPIVNEDYFVYSLKLNNVEFGITTSCYWINAMKQCDRDPMLKDLKLEHLYVPFEGGEPMSAGEEKALNKWLKKVKAGTLKTHTPFCIAKMCIGGGDSEHGALFQTIYRDYLNKLQKIRGINEPIGMDYYKYATIKCLRPDGTFCNPMEKGRLVANSPISMKEYYKDPEATKEYFIKDAYGNVWGDLNCYGYIDKYDRIYVKGRIKKDDLPVKNYEIDDIILLDSKNIMTCETVSVKDEFGNDVYVSHIEFQYNKKVNVDKVLSSARERIKNKFGSEILNNIYFRIHSNDEGLPTLFTAKRDKNKLKDEGLSNIYKVDVQEKNTKVNKVRTLSK